MFNHFFYFITEKALAAPFEKLVPGLDPTGANNQFTTHSNSSVESLLFTNTDSLAVKIFEIITLIAGVLAVLYLIWSGIQYIISAGNAERIKSARSGIINAIIGIVIIVAAYAIVRFAISIANTINDTII